MNFFLLSLFLSINGAYAQELYNIDEDIFMNKLVRATSYRSCEFAITQNVPIENSISHAIQEISRKYSFLAGFLRPITLQDVDAFTRVYCPIVYGELSEETKARFRLLAETKQMSEVFELQIPSEFRGDNNFENCRIISRDILQLEAKGLLDINGDSCKIYIKNADS